MFYKLNSKGKIASCSPSKYSEDCLYTEKNIIQGFDGKLYFEEETQKEEYLREKNNYEKAMQIRHRITELKKLLSNYDYIGIKIATGRATKEEYATEIQQMIEWANEINELEGGL